MLRPSPPWFTVKTQCFVTGTPVLPSFRAHRASWPHWSIRKDVKNPAAGAKPSAAVSISYALTFLFYIKKILYITFLTSCVCVCVIRLFHRSSGAGCALGELWPLEHRGPCGSRCLSGSAKHQFDSLTNLWVCGF